MKRVFFAVFVLLTCSASVNAQTMRTGVLVVGNGNNAIAAGIQSATSGAKTILLLTAEGFELSPLDKNQNTGVAAEFLRRLKADHFDNATANALLKTWMDSLKSLTVIRNVSWQKFKRSGSGWAAELKNGKTIKAEVLVNADKSGKLDAALLLARPADLWQTFGYGDDTYRTSIGARQSSGNGISSFLSLYSLLNPLQENLVALDPSKESFAAGQAAGATAAYAAFYKLKTSESNLKTIQGELINYKLALVPFSDISPLDSNWKAIQFTGLTGVLKAEITAGNVYFRPDQPVTTEEIKPVLKSYFYKAQIWFDDNTSPEMTIGSTLSLVCSVGHKAPKTTEEELRKKWKTTYHFSTEFDPGRVISRREFAVLVNDYLKPFDVNIDKTGRAVR